MDSEERRRRIVAARTLRGISQAEMDALGREQGLDKQELSRLERGEFGERFTAVQCMTLGRVLRVPESWFTEEDVDEIVGYPQRDDSLLQLVREDLRRLQLAVLQLSPGSLPPERLPSVQRGTGRQRRAPEGDAQ